MALHLAEIPQAVAKGAHAVVLMDQAGWHTTAKLPVPSTITLMPLPAKSPELNPVENIGQFMRDNLERFGRPTVEDHIDRLAVMRPRVMIKKFWSIGIGRDPGSACKRGSDFTFGAVEF